MVVKRAALVYDKNNAGALPFTGGMYMSNTARMVMKIIGASLAFAAFVCLLIGGWHDLSVCCAGVKSRLNKRFSSEYADYADEGIYQ